MNRFSRLTMTALIAAAGVLTAAQNGQAYSYSAWVGMTGANTIAVNPFIGGSFDGTSYTDMADLVLEYGISDYADMFASVNGWGMVRYDFSRGENMGIAALYFDSTQLGLQYHMIKGFSDAFSLEANVYFNFPYGGINSMIENMGMGAIIAPTVIFGKAAFYLEVDPAYTLGTGGGFDLKLVPGLWFKVGNGELSIGVPITGLTGGGASVSYGAWYWIPFTLPTAEAEEAPAEDMPAEDAGM